FALSIHGDTSFPHLREQVVHVLHSLGQFARVHAGIGGRETELVLVGLVVRRESRSRVPITLQGVCPIPGFLKSVGLTGKGRRLVPRERGLARAAVISQQDYWHEKPQSDQQFPFHGTCPRVGLNST